MTPKRRPVAVQNKADDVVTAGQAKRLRNLGPERSADDPGDENWSVALRRAVAQQLWGKSSFHCCHCSLL